MLGSFFQSNCFSYQTLTLTLTFTRVFMYKKTRIHQNTFAFLIKCASFRGDTSTFPAFPLIFPGNSQNFLWILLTPLALMCPGLFILFLNLPLRLQLHNTIPISNNRSFIDPWFSILINIYIKMMQSTRQEFMKYSQFRLKEEDNCQIWLVEMNSGG